MSVNQGIKKYREAAKGKSRTASTGKAQAATAGKVEPGGSRANEAKGSRAAEPKGSRVAEPKGARAAEAKGSRMAEAKGPRVAEPKGARSKEKATTAPPPAPPQEVAVAVDEAAVAEQAQREEEALQKEIAEELEREASHTNSLVKDDYSPVNSSRDQLILEYAPLIKYIAQKIAARLPANIELDDLISSGVIGLMDAIEKYDSGRDNKFKTYAEFRIRGAILDELRAQDWVPRSVREKAKQLERVYSKIEQRLGRQATDDEVCEELGIGTDEFHDMLNQVRSVSLLSYDDLSSFSKADKRSLHGYGEAGSKSPTPFNEVNVASVKRVIADAIGDLPEKQRLVLSLYYFEDLNLKEIGRVLDVTESRVSQLHTQAILRLKSKLRTHWDEFATLFG